MRRHRAGEVTDRELAEALLLEGDERAFRELYQRHTARLYQFVRRLLGGAESDAEDVVQETWLRAAQRLDQFRWESSLATWLSGIGLNVCRDLWRRRNGRDLQWAGDVDLPAPRASHDERIDLERAIALLPAGRRAVLILHDVEGFTHEQIGQRLGIAAGTSKSQLACARRSMRELLGSGLNGASEYNEAR
jgi:RNA polymerase sigma-70 factor (ECF subfamily)